ncbi:MAG: hypothetical protein ABI212_02595 [Burkholderiaceae bacterium]
MNIDKEISKVEEQAIYSITGIDLQRLMQVLVEPYKRREVIRERDCLDATLAINSTVAKVREI